MFLPGKKIHPFNSIIFIWKVTYASLFFKKKKMEMLPAVFFVLSDNFVLFFAADRAEVCLDCLMS